MFIGEGDPFIVLWDEVDDGDGKAWFDVPKAVLGEAVGELVTGDDVNRGFEEEAADISDDDWIGGRSGLS